MRLEIKAIIKGNFLLEKSITAKCYPYDFVISKEEGICYISVSKKVTDYNGYMTKCKINDSEGIPQFTLTSDEIYDDMIIWLQYIESMGAFDFEVESINWDEPQITWIPETDEEKGMMPLYSHQRKFLKKEPSKMLCDSNLSNLVAHRRCLNDSYIPFTYFRQGRNLFDKRQYYFAYINFFMILEYCFSNGQFKKIGLLKEFSSSYLLRKSVNLVLEMLKNETNKVHLDWLKQECDNRHKQCDIDGVLYVFVEYRGLLSHATKYSEKYLFHGNELFSLSFIISIICYFVCGNLEIGNCLSGKQKEEFLFGTTTIA